MDGVLCDFKSPITKALGKESYEDVTENDVDDFFEKNDPVEFFANLPKFPYTDYLVQFAITRNGFYNICSRPLKHKVEETIKGKNIWIDKHLISKPEQRIFTFNKEDYATSEYAMGSQKPDILIDDWDMNIDAWNKAGGIGIEWEAGRDSIESLIKKLNKYI